MKKSLGILGLIMLLLTGTLSAQQQYQQLNLDTALTHVSRYVENALQQGTVVAVLNFNSPSEAFSDYVIKDLTGRLVINRKVTLIDCCSLTLIRKERNLQLSGNVSNESARAIGQILGAQFVVSGSLTNMETFYRFRIKVINVETALLEAHGYIDLQNDEQVALLLGNNPASVQPTTPVRVAPSPSPSVPVVTTPPIRGIAVPGANLAAKLIWLGKGGDSHNTYILEVNANEVIAPHVFEFVGGVNITVVLRGVGANRIVRLQFNGTMFTIKENVTFILENNITLQGHNGNDSPIINVAGGTFRMNAGSTITGNLRNLNSSGGGVYVGSGTFEMTGGTISGNSASFGGGIYIFGGTFNMRGGTIRGNMANRGGGVYVNGGTFTMRDGNITGNTARENGGGVYISYWGFTKSGGIITGYNIDQNNGNVVRDSDDYILARKGHAVWANNVLVNNERVNLRKETTSGPNDNLSVRNDRGEFTTTGAWDR